MIRTLLFASIDASRACATVIFGDRGEFTGSSRCLVDHGEPHDERRRGGGADPDVTTLGIPCGISRRRRYSRHGCCMPCLARDCPASSLGCPAQSASGIFSNTAAKRAQSVR